MNEEFKDQIRAKKRNEHKLLNIPNVAGVGVGPKVTKGEVSKETAIRVYVHQKFLPNASGPNEIPKEIDGIKTDVIQLKINTFAGGYAPNERVRPLSGGCSVGSSYYPVGGTLTTVVKDIENPSLKFGLSCYHVLCPTNQPSTNETIVQPSIRDGGDPSDAVGTLGWQTLMEGLDCGLIELANGDPAEVGMVGAVQLTGVGAYTPTIVKKCGKESDVTEGEIIDYDLTFDVQYDFGRVVRHQHLFLIRSTNHEPFAKKGDSGAMVYDDNNNAFGMLIGGDETFAAAMWIEPVLNYLSVTI